MPGIEITGARRRFGSGGGFGPITLSIPSGSFVAILGPTGCGKTTLLESIAGLQRCDSGMVTVDGVRVNRASSDRQIVFQDDALFPWLTVEENVAFGLQARGERNGKSKRRVATIVSRLQLSNSLKLRPHELSAGYRQFVAIARALAVSPSTLLLDDPFASFDDVTRAKVHRELQGAIAELHATTVMVTHNVREACLLADRVIVLSASPGQVVDDIPIKRRKPRDSQDVDEYIVRAGKALIAHVQEAQRG